MQNMIEEQEALKDFSDQQLIKEMQMPSGGIRPISVVSELNRRRRMRADQDRAEAANAPTVAEEVVMAAGMGDMSQMAQAMAPKTSMTENTGIAAMMPKQPTRMATGGVVKMQEAGSVQEQIDKIMAEARANPNSITNTLQPAITELSLKGSYGKEAQRQVVQAAIAGELGLEMQREVLAKALAGEYGDEVKEGAKRASGALEQSGLRGFEPASNQLAPTASVAETVVSPSRGFKPTSNQLAPTAATAETVKPEFESGVLKSGIRGFEPTSNQLAPTASVAKTVTPEFESGMLKSGIRGFEPTSNQLAPTAAVYEYPPSMMTMPAMRDPAVIDPTTGQPYDVLGSMRQQAEQTRQAEAQAAFEQSRLTPDELMVPFNNSPDPADLTRFLASQKPRYQGGNVPGGSLPSENQRLIEEAAEMKEKLDLQRAESNFMNPDRFNRTPEDKLKSPEEQFAELGATKQIIDGEEFFVTPVGNTYDSSGRPVQGGKAIQAIQSAQIGGADFSKSPLGEIPFGSNQVDAEGNVIPGTFKKAELNIGDLTTPDPLVNFGKGTKNLINQITPNIPFIDIPQIEEGSASVTDVASANNQIAKNRAINPNKDSGQGLTSETIAGDPRIASGVVGETVKEDKKENEEAANIFKNISFAKNDKSSLETEEQAALAESEALRTNNRGFTPDEDLIESETAAIATKVANEAGGAALGAGGPEAAKAAQQEFSKDQWMRFAMFGLIASEGTAKSRSEAAKTYLAMDAKDKDRTSKEKIATDTRASQERIAGIKSRATQENTAARIRSATLNRDFRVLESIQDELKESLALITPLKPGDPVSAQNKDAYNTLTKQLKEVREQIRGLGSFDLGPGSGRTEIAGNYNVTAGAT